MTLMRRVLLGVTEIMMGRLTIVSAQLPHNSLYSRTGVSFLMIQRKVLVSNKQEERDTADLAEIEQRFDINVEKYLKI